MQNRCAFYSPEHSQLCELIEATTKKTLHEAQRAYLERIYCNSDQHRSCPVFRQFERCLSRAELELKYPRVA